MKATTNIEIKFGFENQIFSTIRFAHRGRQYELNGESYVQLGAIEIGGYPKKEIIGKLYKCFLQRQPAVAKVSGAGSNKMKTKLIIYIKY